MVPFLGTIQIKNDDGLDWAEIQDSFLEKVTFQVTLAHSRQAEAESEPGLQLGSSVELWFSDLAARCACDEPQSDGDRGPRVQEADWDPGQAARASRRGPRAAR